MKPTVAIVRGKFLNRYEMQFFEPLTADFNITAFGSLTPYHDRFAFPVVKLPSPIDLPDFPYKMPILNRLFVDAHYLWGLKKRLRGFDLVHTAETYFHYTQQALSAKKKGYVKKVIATVLENIPFNNEGIWGRLAFKKRAHQELDHLIALTQRTKKALILEGCEPSKITVIGHFVDTKKFCPTPDRSMPFEKASTVSSAEPTQGKRTFHKEVKVLFVGRLEEEKGVFDVVEAAARLLSDPELRACKLSFFLVGNGSQRPPLLKREHELGIDSFVRHRRVSYDEMPRVYREADIFVAPSKPRTVTVRGKPRVTWEEQYNTSLLEAQASGLPIVTTRTGGIPENVGDCGIIVPPGDVAALTRELKAFITSPAKRAKYAQKARKRAETVHDIHIGAKKLKNLYNEILAK